MTDKIAEIRARHDATEAYQQSLTDRVQMHDDRGCLLGEVERLTRERDEARAEVERLRKGLRQGFPIRYETAAGCLCPAGANASCQNSFCPRRNPPGVTCGGGRS